MKCPGQDTRDWKPGDIFEVTCPWCGKGTIEFFKDETHRKCPECNLQVKNPKIGTDCAKYCPYADVCLSVQIKEEDDG